MDPLVAGVVVIVAHGFGLLGLWLRMRWRVRQELVHSRRLVALAKVLPHGGEIAERRSDGTWLKLSVTRALNG